MRQKKSLPLVPWSDFGKRRNCEIIWFGRKCNGKRCVVCMNVAETNTFSSSVGKKEYKINHSFNFKDNCMSVHL